MSTHTRTLRLSASYPEDLRRAAAILRQGGTVAFPTETVYGLGAKALSREAVEKIFIAKQRPHWDPLIVHLAGRELVPAVAIGISDAEERLMKAFWPGPLTLLLQKTASVPDAVTAGRPLVGVRVPAHPVALALLQEAELPIAAPSANLFGHTSPTTAEHVLADLDGRIDAILDGGSTAVGVESTVVEARASEAIIYRPGAIDESMIESAVGQHYWAHAYQAPERTGSETPESLPSPGVGIRHYAPRAKVILVELQQALVDIIDRHADRRTGVMLPDGWNGSCADLVFPWGPWHQPEIMAQRLYTGLRQLDDQGAAIIICPVPPGAGISEAIRDRLRKAARE